jgi:hypothetical protein
MNAPTIRLLNIVGSPFISNNSKADENGLDELLEYSKKNRMPLLYLRALKKNNGEDEYDEKFNMLTKQWADIEERLRQVIEKLEKNNIGYTTFKSIKPFVEVTVDIDLLIMHSYEETLNLLIDSGYTLLERGPLSATFRDPLIKIDYDIYNEVGVSYIIYFDKEKVTDQITLRDLRTGGTIESLNPVTDLLAVIAHSVIKEQMYTLSEYYTTLYYLSEMDESELKSLIEMARDFRLVTAIKAHIGLTHYLHRLVHGEAPWQLEKIISIVGSNGREVRRAKRNQLKMPHKFHAFTMMRAFAEKLGESKTRRSFLKQITMMTDIEFLRDFIPKFLGHLSRESY